MKIFIYALVVVCFLDNFVQLPIVSPFAQSLQASPMMIGLAVGMYSFTNLIGNVLAGKWIDQYGAKNILIVGMAATAGAMALYVLVHTPGQLVAMRSLHGFVSGLLTPGVFTLISRRADSSRQGRNMAYSGAAVGIAAVIGPAMGGIGKATFGIEAVFVGMAGLLVVAAAFAWFGVKDRRKLGKNDTAAHGWNQVSAEHVQAAQRGDRQVPGTRGDSSSGWLSLFTNPFALQAYVSALGLTFAMGVLTYMLPLKAEALLMEEQTSGLMFSTFGLTAIAIFVLPTNRIYDRVSSQSTIVAGLAMIGASMAALSFFASEATLYGVMVAYGAGFALLFPSMNALLVKNVPESDRGKAFGLFYAFYSIGVVAGSFTIGAVAPSPDGGFLIGGGLIALAAVVMFVWTRYGSREAVRGDSSSPAS